MKDSISKKQLRKFGLFVGIAFPIIIGYIIPIIRGHDFAEWTLLIGLPLLIIGIIRPELLQKPYKFWMTLGHKLGWINSHIILGLVFILVLQPIALIMRIFGYDPLRVKRKDKKSYREINKDKIIDLNRIF